jgi:protein-disulfide isomerase
MRTHGALAALVGLALLVASSAVAQPGDDLKTLRKEIDALRDGQATILKELRELKGLLQGRQAARPAEPPNVVLSTDGAPFVGDPNAKVTLLEFSDYHCPFCARHFSQTLPQIVTDYVKTGKVKYVFRDFPIESLHPRAFKVHEAAYCAGDQGKYWEMHDRLFANRNLEAGPKELVDQARALGLDASSFQQCLDGGKHAARIRAALAEGQTAGVSGTPSFFLGATQPNDSKVRSQRKITGAVPYAQFKEAIDGLLSSPKP